MSSFASAEQQGAHGSNIYDLSHVEETIQKLTTYPGVQGIIISNPDGIPIRSTLEDDKQTSNLANLSARLLYQGDVYLKTGMSLFQGQQPKRDSAETIRIRSSCSEIIILSTVTFSHENSGPSAKRILASQAEYPIIITVIQSLNAAQ
jgi:predicted regulator of Ras-like GTPase activity (Roadblock/LC7/MglB family)